MDVRTASVRSGRRRRLSALGAAAAAVGAQIALAGPASAAAGTIVQRVNDVFIVFAADGKANNITVADDPNGTSSFVISDSGDVITLANGCTLTNAHTAFCPRPSAAHVSVDAGDGDDTITKTTIFDAVLTGGAGNDTISTNGAVGAASDVLFGGPGNDTMTNTTNSVLSSTMYGGAGVDTLNGGPGSDFFEAGPGNDRINGRDGNDTLESADVAADGADVFDGGTGVDTVSYRSRTGAVTVTLDGVANDGATNEADNNVNVESVTGGAGADVLTGNAGGNVLFGGAGADTLDGLGGNDLLTGDAGSDTLLGGPGPVTQADGTVLSDSDLIDGGTSIDAVRYNTRTGAVSVSLDNAANDGAPNEGDQVRSSNENIITGAGNDTVTGSADANTIVGGAGNDTINGGAGVDTLEGGDGNDTINGVDQVAGNDELDGGVGGTDTCNSDAGDTETDCEI
jgi:Ca2+-binding RTX toxin-like protein